MWTSMTQKDVMCCAKQVLEQCCPKELSEMVDKVGLCTAQDSSHDPHTAVEHWIDDQYD